MNWLREECERNVAPMQPESELSRRADDLRRDAFYAGALAVAERLGHGEDRFQVMADVIEETERFLKPIDVTISDDDLPF